MILETAVGPVPLLLQNHNRQPTPRFPAPRKLLVAAGTKTIGPSPTISPFTSWARKNPDKLVDLGVKQICV